MSEKTAWLARLETLQALKADWDTYGSKPISDTACVNVTAFIDALDGHLSQGYLFPANDGGLEVEGKIDGRFIVIEFRPDGSFDWLHGIDLERTTWVERESTDMADVVKAWEWLEGEIA